MRFEKHAGDADEAPFVLGAIRAVEVDGVGRKDNETPALGDAVNVISGESSSNCADGFAQNAVSRLAADELFGLLAREQAEVVHRRVEEREGDQCKYQNDEAGAHCVIVVASMGKCVLKDICAHLERALPDGLRVSVDFSGLPAVGQVRLVRVEYGEPVVDEDAKALWRLVVVLVDLR